MACTCSSVWSRSDRCRSSVAVNRQRHRKGGRSSSRFSFNVLDGLSKAVITPYCSWSARNLMPILRSFVPILYDLNHPAIKVSKFGGSFFQCGSFGLDLVCTPALFLLDLGRKRIHARENLFSGGFICIRPTF